MRDYIYSVLFVLFVMALIVGGFRLYKWYNPGVIESGDDTMVPQYPAGQYSLDDSFRFGGSPLRAGQAIAFRVPGKVGAVQFAWVHAVPGDTVAVRRKGREPYKLIVNGQPSNDQPRSLKLPVEEAVVPDGCVFVIPNYQIKMDSTELGPIPLRNVMGRVKADPRLPGE